MLHTNNQHQTDCQTVVSRIESYPLLFLGEGTEHFYQYVDSLVGAAYRALD